MLHTVHSNMHEYNYLSLLLTLLDGLSVEEPLHLEGGVGDGDDPGLEVDLLTLLHLHRLGGGGEDGRLAGHLLLELGP